MGQQQLLLIILGVIIVGIAIAVGITMFSAGSVQSAKDAIINDMNNLAANAYQHRIRPASMSGGAGAYDASLGGQAYAIPTKLQITENANYMTTPPVVGADAVTFTGTHLDYGTVEATVGVDGKLTGWAYTGQFE
ncbi:MAG: hypothetical protein QME58_11305 [Bacteroidota bacterium]|nr:hypothetical protein [Bacteroidota bacterium]